MCPFMKDKIQMLNGDGLRLDDIREGYRYLREISLDGADLDPPSVSYYDSWDQWVNEMERPNAYMDQLSAQGLSDVYGVCIRLLCDGIPEPVAFYLGPGTPSQLITLTFRTGGLRYIATRPISTAALVTTKKRK